MTRRARDFDRWVRLTMRGNDGQLFVDYEDETGRRVDGEIPVDATTLDVNPEAPMRPWSRIHVPPLLTQLLRESYADRPEVRAHLLPERRGSWEEALVPWLLPVFVVPPDMSAGAPWERWLETMIFRETDLAERCVLLRHVSVPPAPPLELPLRIDQVDSPGVDWFALPGDWFGGVRSRSWYANQDAVREFGLRLPPDLLPEDGAPQLVVRALGEPLPTHRQATKQPLVVLTIAQQDPSMDVRKGMPLPEPGMSHILVMPRLRQDRVSGVEVVTQVVYALVHDFALHEIAWILRRTIPDAVTWVATDERANQALRLSGAMRRMVDDALAGRGQAAALGGIGSAGLRNMLRQLVFDFTRESRGLTAMAQFFAAASIGARSAPLTDGAFETAPEPRRADVALEEYDAFGVLLPMSAYERARPLRRGWRYRLRVHIGSPDRESSAVVGEVTPIDSLIPRTLGAMPRPIEVAVFSKRFELLSSGVQTIELPLQGSGGPVHFELRAPQDTGPADLRIGLYWHNNLLQSFVLEAEVADGEPDSIRLDSPVVRVRLDASGVDDFAHPPRQGARALSVALNEDVQPGSHTVMLKGTGWREEVSLSTDEMTKHMERFRSVLNAAAAAPSAGFEPTVRRLAAIGRGIWDMLSLGDGSDAQALESLRTSARQTIQFVRHGSGRPFPWQTVYDYALPQGQAFANARICRADRPVIDPQASTQDIGCPHCPGQNVVCIEGFWSVRHRIELLREEVRQEEAAAAANIARAVRASRASAPASNPLVVMGVGTPSGAVTRFEKAVQEKLGGDFYRIVPDDAPVADLMWDTGKRPALLIILSHLELGNDELNLPTLLRAFHPSGHGDEISVPQLALRKAKAGLWKEPQRPLVLLLACQSARRNLGDLTSLVDAFLQIGAAGVGGTEWDVKTSLATDFASAIIDGALEMQPVPLGESVRRFLQAALQDGEAMPFAFTVYGDADLTVGRPL